MTESRFKVIFTGEPLPGFALETVKDNLATLFKSDADRISSLFTGGPVALKRALSETEADKYLHALGKAGARVHKELEEATALVLMDSPEPTGTPPMSAARADAQMICPKCGHAQARAAECAACGVIIEKFIARQAQQAAATPPAMLAAADSHPVSPYNPPQSAVGEPQPEHGELYVFSVRGRIGRLRYLAWSVTLTLLAAGALLLAGFGYTITPGLGVLLIAAVIIAALVVGVQISVQRLHDIGWSGWLCLLALVPYLGSLFNLVILLIPGSKGPNRFGPPPPENSRAVKILAVLSILVPVVFGILAALAIPQYQSYMERAQQAEQQGTAQPTAGE
ncbi:DUF805 domain-containing protein [Pseudomonas sp. N040]|uniref:DUF805 domain-containing protein n=1 Tax=Pseudomonas sp. N040 TaxID=2785325 RepID=UPI0018A277EF|nr:DUF805 domain-containing protein [Pseudomonas sp. N040]MBF7728460.1 DUF805 domain-containing protein [Pseudomonas sp. N040]MBW7012100.1 DUF805 domain-containing protein [Pseudomonas sp. N040]